MNIKQLKQALDDASGGDDTREVKVISKTLGGTRDAKIVASERPCEIIIVTN